MKKAYLLFIIISLSTLSSQAQNHQLEFQLAAINNVPYLEKSSPKAVSEFGGNYLRYLFPRTYLVLGLQGNAMNYNETNTDTLNEWTGSLEYRQWMGSIGVRHLFREEIVRTFNYFAEFDFHYTRVNTAGLYEGGQFGSAYYNYQRFKGVGVTLKAGAIYQFYTPWYVGINAAIYFTGGLSGSVSDYTIAPDERPSIEDLNENDVIFRSPIELRVGYRFW